MIILVTGGEGYIGSHCVVALLKSGFDVVVLDSRETGHIDLSRDLSDLKFEGKLLESIEGNLLDDSIIDKIFKKYKVDTVIHFAAYSIVPESGKDPSKYYNNNVVGTLKLLDSMRCNGIDKIVFSSTAAVYGEPEYTPIDEKSPLNPVNTYGRSKMMVERVMDDYDKAYGLRSVRLRYFNVAGASTDGVVGEWHDPETHLIPMVLASAIDGKQFRLYGDDYPTKDGTCIRDYVNVEDLIDAHILALEYLVKGGRTDCFNLGTNDGYSVKEILDECKKVVGKDIDIIVEGRRPGDPASLVADHSKATEVLGWKPKRTLAHSIRTAYDWEIKKRGMR